MSNKRTHKNKLHLARQMMTKAEISAGVSPWDSAAWRLRSAHRETREILRAKGIKKDQ